MTLAAACTLGVLAGIAFGWLWLLVVPWAVHLRFWSATTTLTRDILKVDDAGVFFGLYRNLLGAVARYVGRNLAGTLVAGIPLVAVLLIAAPLVDQSEIPFFIAFMVAMMAFFLWPSAKAS